MYARHDLGMLPVRAHGVLRQFSVCIFEAGNAERPQFREAISVKATFALYAAARKYISLDHDRPHGAGEKLGEGKHIHGAK